MVLSKYSTGEQHIASFSLTGSSAKAKYHWAKFLSSMPRSSYAGCFENSFTTVFQMLLYGECYENIYT
jgi:hypothetical protein